MRTIVAFLGLTACLLGCSAQPEGAGRPDVTTPRTVSKTPTATTSAPDGPPSLWEPMPTFVKVPWRVLARVPRADGATSIKSDGTYRVTITEADPGTVSIQDVRVTDPDGSVAFERHGASPGAFVQDVWLSGGHLVVEEINEEARTVRLQVYDLTTGREVPLPGRTGPSQPEIDAARGRIAFITGFARTRMCVVLIDLRRGTSSRLTCSAHEAVLGDVALGTNSVVFSSVTDPGTDHRCKRLFAVTFAGSTSDVPTVQPCLGWSGVSTVDLIAWDETDPSTGGLPTAAGFIRIGDGPTLALDAMDTDSLVACGGRLFWSVTDGRGPRIDRWTPAGRVDTVLAPHENVGLTTMYCTENRYLSLRTDDIDGVDEHYVHYLLDARRS